MTTRSSDRRGPLAGLAAAATAPPAAQNPVRSVCSQVSADIVLIRLGIVTAVRFYRDGLVQMLRGDRRIAVVAAVGSGGELLRDLANLAPQVVLLDIMVADSVETVSAIRRAAPEVKLVALGVPEVEADIVRFAEVGVDAYVPPQAAVDDLIRAVNGVVRGEFPCSPRIAAALLRRVGVLAAAHGPESEMRQLTSRERQIVQLIQEGLTNKEIARRLCVEVPTVKNHVHSLLKKLHVQRRGQAAALLRGAVGRWVRSVDHGSVRIAPLTG